MEVAVLRAFDYDVSITAQGWKDWLSELQCRCLALELLVCAPELEYLEEETSKVINGYCKEACPVVEGVDTLSSEGYQQKQHKKRASTAEIERLKVTFSEGLCSPICEVC